MVTKDEWALIDSSVKVRAVQIAKSIKEAHNKIAKAKSLAEKAPKIKGGFLGVGKQKKVTAVLSESQVITNEAVTDLAELIQQSIGFTLQSIKTASNMQKALASLAVNGIRDANGRVETLSTDVTDSINEIIDSAQAFLKQQTELSERLEKQKDKDEEQDEALKRNDNQIIELEVSLRGIIDFNKKSDEGAHRQLREDFLAELQKLKRGFLILSCFIGAIAVVVQ